MEDAYGFHRMLLEVAPYHLTISPLDVDYVELMFGFDLECKDNHDKIIHEALYGDGPLGDLLDNGDGQGKVLDVQPIFGVSLTESGDLQAYYEVKSRPKNRRGSSKGYRGEPISLFLTLRRYGPIGTIDDLGPLFDDLTRRCEALASEKLVPDLLTPIARQITSSSP